MYGTQIGTLELVKDSEEVLWSLTGRQKNEWLFAQIKIPAGNYLVNSIGLDFIIFMIGFKRVLLVGIFREQIYFG
jgi:hypothetical protein